MVRVPEKLIMSTRSFVVRIPVWCLFTNLAQRLLQYRCYGVEVLEILNERTVGGETILTGTSDLSWAGRLAKYASDAEIYTHYKPFVACNTGVFVGTCDTHLSTLRWRLPTSIGFTKMCWMLSTYLRLEPKMYSSC